MLVLLILLVLQSASRPLVHPKVHHQQWQQQLQQQQWQQLQQQQLQMRPVASPACRQGQLLSARLLQTQQHQQQAVDQPRHQVLT
jgi:hypothetical protein